jgi:signal transduction histidine kinase/GGDEF domain-containing protein
MEASPAVRWEGAGGSEKKPSTNGFPGGKAPPPKGKGEKVTSAGVKVGNKILVVDDEKEIRELLLMALSRIAGFHVEMAEDGAEALKKIEKDHFDLVLTDLQMPNVDGLQLISEITRSKPEILTVIMTGYGTIDSALEAMKKGASDYLTKPLNLDELTTRLRKVVEEKQRFTNLKYLIAELERTNEELRKVDGVKSEFVSVASHELRTPLSSIKNAVQLILNGKTGEVNETQIKFLSMAERNIDRLTNILNNLLDLSRIEAGKIGMKFEELDPRTFIEFVVSSLKPQADGKSIELGMEIPAGLPPVYGDREKAEQILTNLIGNAIKFTPEGGKVSVSAKVPEGDGSVLAITVKDSGIGIPKDQQGKVFEKFHQVDTSLHRSTSGTGLGLAITKGLVEAHQGRIWVESETGKGSNFTFTLLLSKGEKRDPHFRLILDREFRSAQENRTPLTLFLIEVSNQGSNTDDPRSAQLLDRLEEKIRQTLFRKSDRVVRRAKDSIVAVLCQTDSKGAKVILHRIEGQIQGLRTPGGEPFPNFKAGVATYPEETISKRELFRKAKEQLRG